MTYYSCEMLMYLLVLLLLRPVFIQTVELIVWFATWCKSRMNTSVSELLMAIDPPVSAWRSKKRIKCLINIDCGSAVLNVNILHEITLWSYQYKVITIKKSDIYLILLAALTLFLLNFNMRILALIEIIALQQIFVENRLIDLEF